MSRRIVWFSCGIASAAAAIIAHDRDPTDLHIVYCDVMSDEHPDNERFYDAVKARCPKAEWHRISSEKYDGIDAVFEARRYLAGIAGAPCTVEMKKVPRFRFQRTDDVHTFGYTSEEQDRIDRLEANEPGLVFDWIIGGLTKAECRQVVIDAGIEPPAMYTLGYRNNNCLGCVKATSARYWNMIRRDFPDIFDRRARQSREYGARLTRVRDVRVFLDELPEDYLPADDYESISCGPDCGTGEQMSLAMGWPLGYGEGR